MRLVLWQEMCLLLYKESLYQEMCVALQRIVFVTLQKEYAFYITTKDFAFISFI